MVPPTLTPSTKNVARCAPRQSDDEVATADRHDPHPVHVLQDIGRPEGVDLIQVRRIQGRPESCAGAAVPVPALVVSAPVQPRVHRPPLRYDDDGIQLHRSLRDPELDDCLLVQIQPDGRPGGRRVSQRLGPEPILSGAGARMRKAPVRPVRARPSTLSVGVSRRTSAPSTGAPVPLSRSRPLTVCAYATVGRSAAANAKAGSRAWNSRIVPHGTESPSVQGVIES